MGNELEFRWEFDVRVPRERLWRFVSDTERINRLAGLFKVHYRYEPQPTGGSIVRASASSKGLTLEWTERPAEWQEPERFTFLREYQAGPFETLRSTCELVPGSDPGSTRIVQTIRVLPRNLFGRWIARFAIGIETRRGFERAYGLAEQWARGEDLPATGTEDTGSRRVDGLRVRSRLDEVARGLGLGAVSAELGRYLVEQPDSEVASLRPYRLASRWGIDRAACLRFFLHATKAGLFDLNWSLLCPSCRRSKSIVTRLRDIAAKGHCDACNIRFDAEFDRSVEVTFSPIPLGLGLEAAEYCHAGPGNTPHWVGNWPLAAGERRRVRLTVPPGMYQFLSPQAGGVYCEFRDDATSPTSASVVLGKEGIAGVPGAMRAGEIEVEVLQDLGLPEAEFRLARTEWGDEVVTAAEVTTIHEFRTLFGSEILAPGACFSIRSMAFLFSDLVGSTAMYEMVGDATAFSLVRSHFELLEEIYSRNAGTLVKTIGDAVMAAFREPAQALRAAIEMQEGIRKIRDPRSTRSLELRIGLHSGPCITMEANERLDFFGTTVNLAARVQRAAEASEIAVTESMLEPPDVAAVLAGSRWTGIREVRQFKGIGDRIAVRRLVPPEDAVPGATG